EEAFRLCDVTDDHANAIGATNTLWLEGNRLFGSNTDSYGFSTNLDDQVPGWDAADTALILGAGGASRAIIHAIQQRKIPRIFLANRTRSRAERLAAHFGPGVIPADMQEVPSLLGESGLIVNTTSLGMTGHEPLDVGLDNAPRECVVSDLVYTPLETPFLAQAHKLGLRTSDGLGMLLHQAVPGFARWFGIEPKVDQALRNHVLAVLSRRNNPRDEGEAG
ncbi:MAG: shikimate dehydrogenase, partial [Pseudomonadota bacterium]